ncbi:hypothetical protein PVAP13_4NG211333 [Panicum virgatum]|uniref:Uncharacterized protein n=1 Tax=Panicum virgatum TaxID=38727 RepID=A0A8T0T3I7_PANVG|nr:hypothetical protein PVAP13_4NG211333 [Panicum virgatum]
MAPPVRGFMADLRRVAPRPAPPHAPPGRSGTEHRPLIDDEGFQLVVPRRRSRAARAGPRHPPGTTKTAGARGPCQSLLQLSVVQPCRCKMPQPFPLPALRGGWPLGSELQEVPPGCPAWPGPWSSCSPPTPGRRCDDGLASSA